VGVLLTGTVAAFVLSRFSFPGRRVVFYYFISTMMFPGVLTLVPSFLLVKQLGLLNSYSALIFPMIAGGQVFAIFVFKSFFDGLPQDLLDAAKIDGAGFLGLYWHVVVPLSQPVIAVVVIMNILGTWNSFLWPFIVNTDARYHIVASGLYVLSVSESANNMGVLFAAYVLSSIPLLILFAFATRPFMQGMTSGAFKA
jgi:ABC-type glycerol-3-phosphate transport system permease component